MRMGQPRCAIWNSTQEEYSIPSQASHKISSSMASISQGIVNKNKKLQQYNIHYIVALLLLMGSSLTISFDIFGSTVYL